MTFNWRSNLCFFFFERVSHNVFILYFFLSIHMFTFRLLLVYIMICFTATSSNIFIMFDCIHSSLPFIVFFFLFLLVPLFLMTGMCTPLCFHVLLFLSSSVNKWISLELLIGAWGKGSLQKHGKLTSAYTTQERVSPLLPTSSSRPCFSERSRSS